MNICWYNSIYLGTCGKGDRCKFSHDLEIERKAEKRSLYCDVREDDKETSEDWDEEKLKDVIEKKHAEADKSKATKTEIVSSAFISSKKSVTHFLVF